MITLIAFIMAIIYSIKARRSEGEKAKNYRKGANVWGIVLIAMILIELTVRFLIK